jgi:AraC-like DNA-binding protein
MAKAAVLLAGPEGTIKDIARLVGYRQPAQFAKAFRRAHGVSPSDHRARSLRAQVPRAA